MFYLYNYGISFDYWFKYSTADFSFFPVTLPLSSGKEFTLHARDAKSVIFGLTENRVRLLIGIFCLSDSLSLIFLYGSKTYDLCRRDLYTNLNVFKGVCMFKYLQKQNTRQKQANGKHMVYSYRQHFANCSLTRLMSHATGGQPTTKMTFSKARTKESEDGGEREKEKQQ